jgi:hypothetical protein
MAIGMSMTAVTVECDEKSAGDKEIKRGLGALSPAAQSEAERCRMLLGHFSKSERIVLETHPPEPRNITVASRFSKSQE